jgi:cell division protein FtsB
MVRSAEVITERQFCFQSNGENMKKIIQGCLRRSFPWIAVAASIWLAVPAKAQQADPNVPAAQDEVNKQLQQRIDELEKQVKQLEGKQTTPAPEPPPDVEAPAVNEVAPRLKLIVFGDMGATVLSHVPSTFEFGSLDLFMTARLSDKVSSLGEALFIAQSDNNVQVDVERLLLGYRQSDYFNISIGRYHTWVGYYNTAFNKAEFLETPSTARSSTSSMTREDFSPCRTSASMSPARFHLESGD